MIARKLWVTISECYAVLRHVWRPNTGCCEHWFNPIATLSLCQLPVNNCCSWPAVSVGKTVVMPELQVDPLGRALSTPPLCPGEAAGEWGEMPWGGGGGGGKGGGQTESSCWLIYQPEPPSLPLSLSPYGFLLSYFEHVCCGKNVHEGTVTHAHTLTLTH